MSLLTILSLKRAALQTRIDAISAKEASLNRKIAEVGAQTNGLGTGEAGAGFQIAAMAARTGRGLSLRWEAERKALAAQRETLVRERLTLDIAERKLSEEAVRWQRLEASRAQDRL